MSAPQVSLPPLRRSHIRCGSAAFVSVDMNTGEGRIFPARCLSWGCPHCAAYLRARWIKTLQRHTFRPNHFVTVTLDPNQLEAACGCECCRDRNQPRPSDCKLLDHAWQRDFFGRKLQSLWQKHRRHFTNTETKLRYFRMFEFHSGRLDKKRNLYNVRLHAHILVESPAPAAGYRRQTIRQHPHLPIYRGRRDWFAKTCRQLGLGVTRSYSLLQDSAEAQAYVTKYTTKQKSDSHRFRVRLVSTTKGLTHERREPRKNIVYIHHNRRSSLDGHTAIVDLLRARAATALALGSPLHPSDPLLFGIRCVLRTDGTGARVLNAELSSDARWRLDLWTAESRTTDRRGSAELLVRVPRTLKHRCGWTFIAPPATRKADRTCHQLFDEHLTFRAPTNHPCTADLERSTDSLQQTVSDESTNRDTLTSRASGELS